MHIVKSGALILKPKETRKQVSDEIYKKLIQACNEYMSMVSRKKMKGKLKKTSKVLAKIILQNEIC